MTPTSAHAWFNGEITSRESGSPSVASATFHLGTGVFDGLMAYWNGDHYYLHRAQEHLERFIVGCGRMGLAFRWTVNQLLSGIETLLKHEPTVTQYVRPIAYRRAPEIWLTGSEGQPVDVTIFTVPMKRDVDDPLTCHISPVERISSRCIPGQTKVSGSYVNSFHARKTAELAGFQDGLMLDREGRLTEASAANVFIIRGNRILTPPLNADVFPGITRTVLLELARRCDIGSEVVDLRVEQLADIDGAFMCSTALEIRPLSRLGERELNTVALPVFRSLRDEFRCLTHQ